MVTGDSDGSSERCSDFHCIREKRDGFSEPVMAAVVVTAVVAMVAVLVAVKKRMY